MNSFRTAGNFLRALLPGTVRVQGSSMEPTFNDGDWLVVTWFNRKQPGSLSQKQSQLLKRVKPTNIVIAEREAKPGVLYIKRVEKIDGNRFWLISDNPEGTDSRTWGWIDQSEICGKVKFRYFRKLDHRN